MSPDDVINIGVTGHIGLTRGSARPIYRELLKVLRARQRYGTVHGITCLADGADSLFARAVRDVHGTFDVVLPGPPGRGPGTRRLLRRASSVTVVGTDGEPEQRYAAASDEVLHRCDVLVAVWDGSGTGVHGGTAHTVAQARRLGKPVVVIWHAKAKRRYVGGGSMSHSSLVPAAAARTSG